MPSFLMSFSKTGFDLLERFTAGLRQSYIKENQAAKANGGIDEEDARSVESGIEHGKRVGEHEAGDPK